MKMRIVRSRFFGTDGARNPVLCVVTVGIEALHVARLVVLRPDLLAFLHPFVATDTEYAKSLEPKLGIPYKKLTPLIFILIRACVHYALFEDEFYLKSQIEVLKEALELFVIKYNPNINT